jgi:hypothetical protein
MVSVLLWHPGSFIIDKIGIDRADEEIAQVDLLAISDQPSIFALFFDFLEEGWQKLLAYHLLVGLLFTTDHEDRGVHFVDNWLIDLDEVIALECIDCASWVVTVNSSNISGNWDSFLHVGSVGSLDYWKGLESLFVTSG